MLKKILLPVFAIVAAANLSGCIILASRVAESQKVVRNFDATYGDCLVATKGAFSSLGLKFEKAVIDENSAKVIGKFDEEKTIRIEIIKAGDGLSTVKVRVGTSSDDKPSAEKIMEQISRQLERD